VDVPAGQVDGPIVELQGGEGGEVFAFVVESICWSEAPIEEVACNLFVTGFDVAREVRDVGVGETLSVVEVNGGL
jgi:hypothetical protein